MTPLLAAVTCQNRTGRGLIAGWVLVAGMMFPSLCAVWLVPGFMTQDGPCHLYNAWILAASFSPDSAYEPYFEVHWSPLPNWAGHLVTVGLLHVTSPWVADRIVISTTSVGLAMALVWLRWRVQGTRGIFTAGLLSALLALNFLWLMGFSSFLLGCILFTVTLGTWWSDPEDLNAGRLAGISALLLVGYFAHLVTLGLTVISLGMLAIFRPGPPGSRTSVRQCARLLRTAICGLPLLALLPEYLRLSRQGGPMEPLWDDLSAGTWLATCVARLGWVDPMTLCRKTVLPFTERSNRLYVIFAPVVWLLLAGLISLGFAFWAKTRSRRDGTDDRQPMASRVWALLGLVLLIAGVIGPDSLGPGHGEYLPQRLALLGMMALVPAIGGSLKALSGRLVAIALGIALVLQTATVWDYAIQSDRTAGQIVHNGDLIGDRQRIASLLIRIRSRFRANPILHADCWLGIGSGNILWSNYETRYYYFPVQFRPELERPDSRVLEDIAIRTDPETQAGAVRMWQDVLLTHGESIDRVLIWGSDPRLDAVTNDWGKLIARRGDVSIYARKASR